jgi:hypothetical protein
VYLPIGLYLLGAFVGVFYPYLRKWLEDGVAFDWRKAAGKALAAVLGLVLVPSFADTIAAIGGMGLLLAFLAGLGATAIGHEAQKTPAAIEAARNG